MSNVFSIRIIAATLTLGVGGLTIGAQTNLPAPTAVSPTAPAPVAQTPSQEKGPRRQTRRPPETPSRVTVVPNETQLAPQVVTIVHRLTGVKLLRFLQTIGRDIHDRKYRSDNSHGGCAREHSGGLGAGRW